MTERELVYLGLGGNLSAPIDALREAIKGIDGLLSGTECSRFYSTEPRYDLDQDRFVNAVVRGSTDLTPLELLVKLQSLEHELGRVRDPSRPKGPRRIDIDILLFGNRVIDEARLMVPHPRMGERKFVLIPLLELDSTIEDPRSGEAWGDQLARLETQGIYYMSVKDYSRSLSWGGP